MPAGKMLSTNVVAIGTAKNNPMRILAGTMP
jgi:hypothetical protein